MALEGLEIGWEVVLLGAMFMVVQYGAYIEVGLTWVQGPPNIAVATATRQQ